LDNQTNKNTAYYLAKAGVELMVFFWNGPKAASLFMGKIFQFKGYIPIHGLQQL
jgi:hypothetical protein